MEDILSAVDLGESYCDEASAWVLQWVCCALVPVGDFEAVKRLRLREDCVACCHRWSLYWAKDAAHLAVNYVVQVEEYFAEELA